MGQKPLEGRPRREAGGRKATYLPAMGRQPSRRTGVVQPRTYTQVPPRPGPVPPVRIRMLGGFRASVGPRYVGQGAWRLKKAVSLVKLLALAPRHRLQIMNKLGLHSRAQITAWVTEQRMSSVDSDYG